MKAIIGLLLIVAGICLGLYVGLWLCFIGGIMDIINAVRAETLVKATVGWGVVKIMFAGFLGWVCALVLIIPGKMMLEE